MPRTATAVLTFGAGAFLAALSAIVGFYTPATDAPVIIAGLTSMIWIIGLIVGRTLNSRSGWNIWGMGCVAGGAGIIANSLSAGYIGPMVAGGAVVFFSLMFALGQRKPAK